MAEVELKVKINDIELEFEGEYNDVVKFYNLIKKDFFGVEDKSEVQNKPNKKSE